MSKSDPNTKLVTENEAKYYKFNQLLQSKLNKISSSCDNKLSLKEAHSADIERNNNINKTKHMNAKSNTEPLNYSIDYPWTKNELLHNYSEPMDAPLKINLNSVRSNPVIIPKQINNKHNDINDINNDKINNRQRSISNASGVSSKRVSFVLPKDSKYLPDKQYSNRSNRSTKLYKKNSNTSSKRVSFVLPNMHENVPVDSLICSGSVFLDLDDELMINGHNSTRSSMRPNKALELLGIKGSTVNSPIHSPNRSRNFVFKHSPKRSVKNDPGPGPGSVPGSVPGTRTPTFGGLPDLVVKLSSKISKSKSKSNMKKSWFVNVVSNEIDNDDEDEITMNTEDLNTPLPDEIDITINELNSPSHGNKTDTDCDEDGFEFVFGNGDDYMTDD
eukprot:367389_1